MYDAENTMEATELTGDANLIDQNRKSYALASGIYTKCLQFLGH